MESVITALKDTQIPTFLVLAGIVFLLLSIVSPLVGKIAVPPERQRWAAIMGAFLLTASIMLYFITPVRLTAPDHGVAQQHVVRIDNFKSQLQNEDPTNRSKAATALGQMGKEARGAIPALTKALTDDLHAVVRTSAATALGQMGKEAREAIPALTKALEEDLHVEVRSSAVAALGEIGKEDTKAIRPLILALTNDSDVEVRALAVAALGQMGKEARGEAIPALTKALTDDLHAVVRTSAATALGQMGEEAREAIPALLKALTDIDEAVRSSAVTALGQIGKEVMDVVSTLTKALTDDPHVEVRASAATALGQMGKEAREAIPALTIVLEEDLHVEVRASAATALGQMGKEAREAIPALLIALADTHAVVRTNAATALGKIGKEAKEAISALATVLAEKDSRDVTVRSGAATALGEIGKEAAKAITQDKEAIPALTKALEEDPYKTVRASAATALGEIGKEAAEAITQDKKAIPALAKALTDTHPIVRTSAATALGQIGKEAAEAITQDKKAIPALAKALTDTHPIVRTSAATALGSLAGALFDGKHTTTLPQLKDARKMFVQALANDSDTEVERYALDVNRTIDYFESLRWVQFRELVLQHPYLSSGVVTYLLLAFVWLLLLWVRPRCLILISAVLTQYEPRIKMLGDINLPLRHLLLLSLFHYHPRVLDACVQRYLPMARDHFSRRETVARRQEYVALSISIEEQLYESLSPVQVQPIFHHRRVTVLITGEGGSGKTSLACQMAHWAMHESPEYRLCRTHCMLPVLLEGNIEPRKDDKNAFLEVIRGHLANLVEEPEPITEELLLQLLRKRRVLVLVDGFSELQEETRKQLQPASAEFPVAALVVTSRRKEWANEVTTTTIQTSRLQGNRLSAFMDNYLKQRGKRDLFEDPEYFAACSQLSTMVGTREITAGIAKMYAEQMIAAKEDPDQVLPIHLPDLMFGYLNTLNRDHSVHQPDNRTVQRIAPIVAWECLKQTYHPAVAMRTPVVAALKKALEDPDEINAITLLQDLEERLQLVQTIGERENQIRFTLDPLAEYLAGYYMLEQCGKTEDWWRDFLVRVQTQPDTLSTSRSFIRAIYECCIAYAREFPLSVEITDELARLAGLAAPCRIKGNSGTFPRMDG